VSKKQEVGINPLPNRHLPDGWVLGEVQDLVKIRNGYAFKSEDFNVEKGVPVIRQTNLSTDTVNFYKPKFLPEDFLENYSGFKIEKGDVLIGLSGSIGSLSTYREDFPALQNQRTGVLIENVEGSKKYVEYFLLSIKRQLNEVAKGVAVQNISSKQIEGWPIPIAPLEQQKRIVAEIEKQFSRLDEAVANLKRVKANLKRYKAAVLKAAVEGKLTEEWRKQHPDVEPASKLLERILAERRQKWEEAELAKMAAKGNVPKDAQWKKKYKTLAGPESEGLPAIPSTWTWATPAQLASCADYSLAIGPFGSNLKVSDYRDRGVPLVFVRNIRTEDFEGENTKYVTTPKAKELKAHAINGGDILITKMGAPPGDACLYPVGQPLAIITADCIKWTLSPYLPGTEFFVNAINSQLIKTQILQITKGVAQQKVSLARFKEIAVPLPVQEEQREILDEVESRLSIIEGVMKTVDSNLKRAESLRQSILRKAFSGELIRNDSSDSPNNDLLTFKTMTEAIG
jgi:type I restriction enzyme S subunit